MEVPNALGASPAPAERKLVAVLVCEIDAPTASSVEHEVNRRDRQAAGHLRRVEAEVARHGGMVVEAVGDMVVAVFGVPWTRDDDPERSVRTALAIRDALTGLGGGDAQLRAGVASGEAIVRPGEPAAGRRWEVSGEVIAAAIAVKNAAPPGAVLVTFATLRATERVISYAPARLLPVAGATEPVAVWDALAPRPSSGRAPSPVLGVGLVGREGELAVLLDRYQRVRQSGRPQLVTLVGAAGIGKSRLLAELGRRVAGEPDPPVWRSGRAQPHVYGGTFGALVELVKAEAGILDSDLAATAERKLNETVTRVISGPPAAWVTQQLRPLVGVRAAGAHLEARGEVERGDVVAAWRWLLRALADQQPLVLSLEDLHWADQLLLDVLDGLVDPALGRPLPLLVAATARPELLDRHPAWTTEQPNRTTLRVGPLATVDTSRLLQALLIQHEMPVTIEDDLLARVGGNPLFAEEYARLLRDRRNQPGTLAIPVTVQAVIAARLDRLPPPQKAVLADAAVLGQVGWVGAIAAVGGQDPDDLDAWLQLNLDLAELERKELLTRTGGSRVAGEVEVRFRHVLVCDVAYAQLPRAARAVRHQRAAAWLEQLAPDRATDRAELLAHHYTQALRSARAAGSPTADLVEKARLALRTAGDHATALGTEALAARYYSEALALWAADDPQRPELEFRAGQAQLLGGGTGEDLLIRARDGLLAQGNRERAAEAEIRLGQLAYHQGRDRAPYLDRALMLVADAPASHSKAMVLVGCMMHLLAADRHHETLEVARETLAMARTLQDSDIEAAALGAIGAARVNLGDPAGLADLERCVAMYEEHGSSGVVDWRNNLAFSLAIVGDLRRCFAVRQAAADAAERFGSARALRWLELERTAEYYWSGHWEQAVTVADSVTAEASEGATHYLECDCRIWRGRIRLARGQLDDALNDAQRALDLARASNDPHLNPALAFAARVMIAAGQANEAGPLADELLQNLPGRLLGPDLGIDLPVAMVKLGRPVQALDDVLPSRWLEAAQAFITGKPRTAADTYAAIGSHPDEAYARLEAARHLLAAKQAVEANTELAVAVAFYRQVSASTHLGEARKLLTLRSQDPPTTVTTEP